MPKSSKSQSSFKVEGLESRILLSAVPYDGAANAPEEPLIIDSVSILDAESMVGPDSLSTVSAGIYETATTLAIGAVYLSGEVAAGSSISAEVIYVADGTVLDGVQLTAARVELGAAVWSGDSRVFADDIAIHADQASEAGAILTLATRLTNASIALGFDDGDFAIDSDEIDRLAAAGLDQLIIGLEDGSHDVNIDGLAYVGDLLLRSPRDGGEFYIISQIQHSGGSLRYQGSGQTQNASADTITAGDDILVDDTLQLVYNAGTTPASNRFGDNTFYFDTTNGGLSPQGADILISGDILGTSFDDGGTLYLNAGTSGNILIQGDVGTLVALGRIVIENANNVTFQGDIILESFEQQAGEGSSTFGSTSSNFFRVEDGDLLITTEQNITFNSDVESTDGNIQLEVNPLTTSGKVWFRANVDLDDGNLIVDAAKDFEITGTATIIGNLQQIVGSRDTIFRSGLQAESIELAADREIRFLDTVTLTAGDMTLVSGDIDFEGGTGSVIGALNNGAPASNLFLRPTAASVDMDIGNPTGGSATFNLTVTDIAALADDFASITIGYDANGVTSTNSVLIGNAAFLDAVSVYGGSFLVNGNFSARTSLLIDADSGIIDVDNSQIRVNNEQLNSVWQSSELNLLAHVGNVLFRNGASLLIDNDDPADVSQGSLVNLTATAGSVTNQAGSFGFVESRDLVVTAANDITLLTNVENVTANSTVAGTITIDELDGLRVIEGITANGAVAFTSGGDTVIDLIESQMDAAANTVSVDVFGGNLLVEQVIAGTAGDVQLNVEGSLTGVSAPTAPHITGDALTITTDNGAGVSINPIQILANSVDVANNLSGIVYLQQNTGRNSDTVSVEIDNLSTASGDYVAFTALGGNVAISGNGISSASDAGILVDSSGALSVDASVSSQGGPITFDAVNATSLGSAVIVDSNGGDVVVESGSDLTLEANASIESLGGAIVAVSGGNVLSGHFDARSANLSDRSTWGSVAIEATGYIHDRAADATANVSANNLKLEAGTGIGQAPDSGDERALEINAVSIAAQTAGNGVALHHLADVSVATVPALTSQILNANGTFGSGPVVVSRSGINNTAGGEILLISDAALVTSEAVETNGAGRVVVIGDAVSFGSQVSSIGGALSLSATNNLTLTDTAALSTSLTADVLLISDAGSILAAAGSSIASGGSGAVVVSANQNVTLGTVTTTGEVGVEATNGSILSASGGDDTRTVISGSTLSIKADGSVAGADGVTDPLLTAVSTLSVVGGAGAVHKISNTGNLTVDTTVAQATRFDSLLVGTLVEVDSGDDVVVSGNGDIDLAVTSGNFELSAANIIETNGAGSIKIDSAGTLTMQAASTINNSNGAIDLSSIGTAAIAKVISVDGGITVESTSGSIIDSDPAESAADFTTTGQLDLTASTGIGIEGNDRQTLSVTLGTLSAESDTGGIFIESATSFATNGVSTTTSGTISLLTDAALTIGKDLSGMAIDSAADLVLRAGTSLTQEADGTITADQDASLFSGTDMLLFSVVSVGNVALEATGSVMGYANPTVPAIAATALLLDGVGSVGLPTQRLATNVGSLAGTVNSGTLAFDNASSLTLEPVSVSTTPTGPMGALPVTPRLQSGSTLTVGAAPSVGEGLFVTVVGDLVVASGGAADAVAVTQALPVLWQTTGNQNWNGVFDYAGGTGTVRAGGFVTISATGAIRSNGGDLSVEVVSDFTLDAGGTIALVSGNGILNSGENLTVEGAISTSGAVALDADDFILAGVTGGPIRVTAADLILTAGDGIGTDTSALTTEVARISSLSRASGSFIDNTGNVEVTNLGFAVTSLVPDAGRNRAFSGYQGGVQTQLSGSIDFDNSGTVQVDPVQAVISAYPDSPFELALLLDNAGPDSNELSVLFEIIRNDGETIDAAAIGEPADLRDGNPPSTKFDSVSGVLRVFVRNDVSTMAEIVSAINAEADFAGSAIFVSGPEDGSTVFSVDLNADTAFDAEGGAYEGLIAYDAGTTAGGLDPIAAVARIQPGDALYSILVSSTQPGAAANNFTVRILDDGPGGRLMDGADEATVEWDSVGGLLDLYINYGSTTSGTIVDAINDAEMNSSVPFTAEFGGSFEASDADDIIGEPSILMLSNLSPVAQLRPVGADNDFEVTATTAGPLFNGINFLFIDDGTVDTLGVRAVFDDINNVMSVFINSGVSTANDVIAALNTEGTFTAAPIAESSGGNNGTGAIQATEFQLRDGAVAVNASVTIDMVGGNNDFTITADEPGDDENAIRVVIVGDDLITPGDAEASYDPIEQILEITINPDFATAGGIIEAINLGPNAASIPLTASLPDGTTGFGGISLVEYPETAGGTGGVARATVDLEGSENSFEVVAESDSVFLQNIRIFVIDDGSITDGSATVNYFSDTRFLIINLETGVTTANTVVTAINDATVPVSATHSDGSSGEGTFGDEAQDFMGGADPVVASLVTELPSGVTVELESTVGGVVNNGVNVSYALDASLAAGTASANLFEADGLRLLQLRAADATTTLDALQAALDAATEVPFTIANIAAIGTQTVGDLAPVSVSANEGAVQLTAGSSVNLIGRVASETGSVSITTSPAGDLTFDAETTSIVSIDGIDIDLAGAFINNASLEDPLLKVYDESLLRISTGALSASSETVVVDTNGSILVEGTGLALADSDFTATAEDDITIDAAINASSVSVITLEAGENFLLTTNGALTADTISIEATTGTADIAGSATADTFELVAAGDISQTGTIDTTGTLDVTSQTGAITMSGAVAASSSVSGAINYDAATGIAVTSIVSTDNGTISLTSGGAITNNNRTLAGINISTGGAVEMTAETGIGLIGDPIRVSSGTTELKNLGATGDIVVTEANAGGNLEVVGLTQSSATGWSILTTEAGNVDFTGEVLHSGTGSLLVDSAAGISNSTVATITLQGGELTLNAVSDVDLNANASTNGGDVYIDSGASVTMEAGITLAAGGGDVAIEATNNVEVAQILSALAGVHIAAANGSITRAANGDRKNVIAANLQLSAAGSLGGLTSEDEALIIEVDRLTATATSGVIAIDSVNDLSIGDTTVDVDFALANKTTDSESWSTSQLIAASGNVVLDGQGSLTLETISSGPTLDVNGNLLASSQSGFLVNGDVDLSGGSAHLKSGGDFTLNGNLDLAGTGTLLVEAGQAFSQADDSVLTTVNLDAIIDATDGLTISRVDLGTGDLALTAGGAIIRPSTAPATQLDANFIRLESGANIGSVADPLVFDAVRVSAAATGGIRLNGVGVVDVDSVEVIADQVSTLGAADTQRTEAAQADIASSAGGDVLLQFGGHLTLRDGNDDTRSVATNGDGRLFISAASIDAYADIITLDGDLTIEIQGAAHWIATPETGPGVGDGTAASALSQTGDIYITTGSDFLMDAGTGVLSASGNIGIDVTGDFTVGSVDGVAGYVHVSATGAILDGGDSLVDFVADRLQLEVGTGAGLLGAATYNPLEINANVMSALVTAGPLALSEVDAIEIGLTEGSVDKLDVDGLASTAIDTSAARYGFESLGGGSVTLVAGGSITAQAAPVATPTTAAVRVAGAGNLLLHANASGASVILEGDVDLTTGAITLRGTNGVSLAANVTVETGGLGTIDVFSSAGGLTMAEGSTITAVAGDVVVETAGNVLVAGIETGTRVSLTSTGGSVLDNEATRVNVAASSLRFDANGDVGASSNAFDTQVAVVSGRTTAGEVYLQESLAGLSIGSTEASSNVVGADGEVTATAVAPLSGIVTGGANGTVVVTLTEGDLTVLAGHVVTAAGTGNVLLETPGQLDIQAAVSSTAGSISLVATNDVLLATGIEVTTGSTGQIYLSAGGALTAGADSRFVASTGNVVILTGDDVTLGGISTEGRAAIGSVAGHIRGAGSTAFDVEVLASQLLMSATNTLNGGIGTLSPASTVTELRTQVGRLAASAGADGIHIVNSIGLTVGSVSVTNSRVVADGTLSAQPTLSASDLTTVTDPASIVLRTLAGSITLSEGGDSNGAAVIAAGAGNILISAFDELAVNADVLSTTGHIKLSATNDYTQAASATVETSGAGTVYVLSTSGAVAMTDGALVKTDASARLEANGTVTLARVEAAAVSVISETGAIDAALNSTLNLQASDLRLEADTGIGSSGTPIAIDGDNLAANTRAGDIFLVETNGISVIENLSVTVSDVDLDASVSDLSDTALSGLTTEVDGSVVLVASLGAITIESGAPVSAATSGNILIEAETSISVLDDVSSGSGNITLDAGNGLSLGNLVNVTTGAADIFLDAGAGSLTQSPSAVISADNNVRLAATGDVTLGQISGQLVSVVSSANIVTAVGVVTNITASSLRLDAGLAIGSGSEHLQLSVAEVAASALSGGIYLTEADDITVTSVEVDTTKVSDTGATSVQTDSALADLRTGNNGQIILVSQGGSITLADGDDDGSVVVADGNGSILIDANLDVNVNADVASGDGHIALRAARDLALSSIDVSTGAGDISLTASTGMVTMPANAQVTSTTGSVRASGATGVTLGQLSGSSVSLLSANGAILGAELSSMNVTASDLRIHADGAIGAANRHILTDVANVSARSVLGAVFLTEASGLEVTSVRVTISEINSTGSTFSFFDAAQSDVVAGTSVVLNVTAGDLILEDGDATVDQTSGDGLSADGQSVQAGADGGILLQTLNGNLVANASVLAGTGLITVKASDSVTVNGTSSIETSGSGDISIEAVQGAITMAADTSASGDAALRLAANGNVTIGSLSGSDVSILSTSGGILGAAGSSLQVDANNLRLSANLSIGTSANFIRTDASVLSALSSTGSVYLTDSSATTVDSVRVETDEFTATAGSVTIVDAAQSDIVTLDNGDIILVVTNGQLTLNDGSGLVDQNGGDGRSVDGVAVNAHGSGRILLTSAGAFNVNANVVSTSGLVTLAAASTLDIAAGVDIETAADVSLRTTSGAILMHGTATVTAENSALRIDSADALVVSNLNAMDVSLLSANDITNASGSSLNVDADSLRIETLGSVGVAGRHLSADVNTLAVQAGGNLFITNLSAVLVGPISFSVTEFAANSSTNVITDATLTDLTASANGALVLKTLAGGIEVPNVSALGSGSIVLDAAGGLVITGAVDGQSGAITLFADGTVDFAAGSSLITSTSDSVYVASNSGAITMAGDATLNAVNAAVTLRSSGDLTLGQVTGQLVSLVSGAGGVVDLGTVGSTVIADQLRISTANDVGSASQALTTTVGVVAIDAGSVYMQDSGALIVGTVGGSFDRILIDLTSVTVNDAAISGIVSSGLIDLLVAESLTVDADVTSTSGDISLVAGQDLRLLNGFDVTSSGAGNLYLEATGGVLEMNSTTILSTGSGNATLLASGDMVLGDITTTGDVALTSQGGSITSAGSGENTLVGGSIIFTADSGIGRTGTGTLNVDTDSLTVVNNGGSVYLNSLSELNLSGLTQNGFGDLYFRQNTGDLTISGAVLLNNGRAILNVTDAINVNAELRANDDLRIVATSLTLTDGDLISNEGDITIRIQGVTTFDATSSATATLGSIRIVNGGILTVGDLTAGTRIDLRADASILRSGGELEAPAVRLFSENGDLGEQLNPLFTNAGRIDLDAGGSVYISEAGGFQLGRSGLNSGGDGVDESIELNFGSGTFSSITGVYEFDGAGTLLLNSTGDLELGTRVRATSGNITISADSLQDGTVDEGLLLEAQNGRLSITTTSGVGGSGAADIDIQVGELTATTVTGDVVLDLTGDTIIVGDGVEIESGNGTLSLRSDSGNLTVDALILHDGSGDILLSADSGSVLMTNAGRVTGGTGLLDIRASDDVVLSQVTSLGGDIFISSELASVRRLTGFTGANIVSTNRAIIEVDDIAQFTVDSDSVTVNGATFFRGLGNSFIFVVLNFG